MGSLRQKTSIGCPSVGSIARPKMQDRHVHVRKIMLVKSAGHDNKLILVTWFIARKKSISSVLPSNSAPKSDFETPAHHKRNSDEISRIGARGGHTSIVIRCGAMVVFVFRPGITPWWGQVTGVGPIQPLTLTPTQNRPETRLRRFSSY